MFIRKKKESFVLPPERKAAQKFSIPSPEEEAVALSSGEPVFPEAEESAVPSPPPENETKKEQKARLKAEKKAEKARRLREGETVPFFRDKRKVGILLIVLSLVTILVIVPLESYLTAERTTLVVTALQDIPAGQQIEREMVATQNVPLGSVLPFQQLALEDVLGKYAVSGIVQEEIITSMKLSSSLPHDNAYLYDLPEGQKAISIALPQLADTLSGKLISGDLVSAYAVTAKDKEEDPAAELYPELTYLQVLAVTNQDGYDLSGSPAKENLEEALPATVTLLVNDRQAQLLAGLESNAALRLGLAYRGESETAKLYLEQQRQYLLEAGAASPPELPPKDSGLPPAEASLGGDIS